MKQNKAIFIILLLLQFYELFLFGAHFWYYILTLFLFYIGYKGFDSSTSLKYFILLYVLFIYVSAVSSYYFNGQPVIGTFVESYPYLGLISCFIYPAIKVENVKIIEKHLVWLGCAFCICYMIQYAVFPNIIFLGASTTGLFEEGTIRIRLAGSSLSFFLYFWGLNNFLERRKTSYLYVAMFALLVPFMMGFRSLLFLAALCTVFLVIKKEGFSFKILFYSFVICLAGYVLSFLPFVRDKIDSMIERQSTGQTFSNSDYIRFIEYSYYMDYVFTNPVERFFGGGTPIWGTRYYMDIMEAFDKSLYWNDWGLIGLSWIIGVIPVFLLVIMVMRACLKHLDEHYFYLKLLLLLLLFGSIATSMEIFRNGNLIIVGIVLFMIEKKSTQVKNKKSC